MVGQHRGRLFGNKPNTSGSYSASTRQTLLERNRPTIGLPARENIIVIVAKALSQVKSHSELSGSIRLLQTSASNNDWKRCRHVAWRANVAQRRYDFVVNCENDANKSTRRGTATNRYETQNNRICTARALLSAIYVVTLSSF